MKRVHIIGLPRSGTTALSEAVAKALGLPLVVEPIFLWNDGFQIDLLSPNLPDESELQKIRNRIKSLDVIHGCQGGFVEKTPSSAFLAPVLDGILSNSSIIVVSRDRSAVVKSLARMVLRSEDGNLNPSESFLTRKLRVRFAKLHFMIQTLGPRAAITAFTRFVLSGHRESITALSNDVEIGRFVDTAMTRLDDINVGTNNKILKINYDQFLFHPNETIVEIVNFCNQDQNIRKEVIDAP